MLPFDRHPERHGAHGGPRRPDDGGNAAIERGRRVGSGSEPASALDPAPAGEASAPRPRRPARGAWLLPPLMLAAIASGVLFVFRGPDQIFGAVFGLVLALGSVWILVSTLLPARADRTCPLCGREGLVRLDPGSTQGLACRLCSWRDESASSFLLAEVEGSLEDIVLRERERGDARRW